MGSTINHEGVDGIKYMMEKRMHTSCNSGTCQMGEPIMMRGMDMIDHGSIEHRS